MTNIHYQNYKLTWQVPIPLLQEMSQARVCPDKWKIPLAETIRKILTTFGVVIRLCLFFSGEAKLAPEFLLMILSPQGVHTVSPRC
jgi:hypothetical protein